MSGVAAGRAVPIAGEAVAPAIRDALAELLLTMADDEFVSGFTDSEWTGIAPTLEEDVAFSSIAQNEIGHARALYELAAAELPALIEQGYTSFKIYMTYDDLKLDDGQILDVLAVARAHGARPMRTFPPDRNALPSTGSR